MYIYIINIIILIRYNLYDIIKMYLANNNICLLLIHMLITFIYMYIYMILLLITILSVMNIVLTYILVITDNYHS